jgi:hypothetical protein
MAYALVVRTLPAVLAPALALAGGASVALAAGPGRAPPAVTVAHALAARCDAALVADRASDLGLHGAAFFNWLGLSFPEVAPRRVGVLRGQDGVAEVLTPAGLASAGIPAGAPVVLCALEYAPAPLLGVVGLDREGCGALRSAVGGGAPENAAAWEAAGVCVTVVGECGRRGCARVGLALPRPGTGTQRQAERLLLGLPAGGVRAVAHGVTLRRVAPRRAGEPLREVVAAAAWLDAASSPWRVRGAAAFTAAPAVLAGLGRLQGVEVATDQDAAVEVAACPTPATLRRLLSPGQPFLGPAVEATWGPVLAQAMALAAPRSVSLSWRGVDRPPEPPADEAATRLCRFHGGLVARVAHPSRAAAASGSLQTAYQQRGFREEGGLGLKEGCAVAVAGEGTVLRVATGATAERGFTVTWAPAQPPAEVSGAVLRVRVHGRRVGRAASGVSFLDTAGVRDLKALLAVRELVGPSLDRVGDVTAWVAPGDRRHTWVLGADVAVGGAAP